MSTVTIAQYSLTVTEHHLRVDDDAHKNPQAPWHVWDRTDQLTMHMQGGEVRWWYNSCTECWYHRDCETCGRCIPLRRTRIWGPTHPKRFYCSNACRQAAYRQRKGGAA